MGGGGLERRWGDEMYFIAETTSEIDCGSKGGGEGKDGRGIGYGCLRPSTVRMAVRGTGHCATRVFVKVIRWLLLKGRRHENITRCFPMCKLNLNKPSPCDRDVQMMIMRLLRIYKSHVIIPLKNFTCKAS